MNALVMTRELLQLVALLVKLLEFASEVAAQVPGPRAYTLDVAWDVTRRRWLVVEGNRAWSSGLYLCDPAVALTVIAVATGGTDRAWLWRPDEAVVRAQTTWEPLRLLPAGAAGGFLRYAPES